MTTKELVTAMIAQCNKVELSHPYAVLWDGVKVQAELRADWYELAKELVEDSGYWVKVSDRYGGSHYGRQYLWGTKRRDNR